MKVIKKINNNIAVCKDGNGQELIAFGRGIGFPKTPYELKDLSKIEMTFYKFNQQNISLLQIIPEKVVNVSVRIVKRAQREMSVDFSPNMIFSLADHINFAIDRLKKNQVFDFSLSYDINHLYPQEYKLGQEALKLIYQETKVKLPSEEATGIALHFINSRETDNRNQNIRSTDELLEMTIGKIENYFQIEIDKNSFIFNRFKVHFQYYLDRLRSNKQITNEISTKLIEDSRVSGPKVYDCTEDIVAAIDEQLEVKSSADECFYLMIYINRLLKQVKN